MNHDMLERRKIYDEVFPSPTGVNYYECKNAYLSKEKGITSFRPQQGLTIMNNAVSDFSMSKDKHIKFPSPTGVNYYESEVLS